MVSAADIGTILPDGAYHSGPPRTFFRLRDRAPAWQFEPGLAVTHRMLYEDHEMPWWNPYQGFGSPWAAGMIQQPFYPLTFLAAIHPSSRMISWFVVVRLLIAGFLAYGFLRYFLDPMSSTLGGLAFMLNGYFVFNLNLDNISTDMLVPLLLIGFEEMIRSNSVRAFLLGIASVWLLLISGMPESAVVIMGFACAYFLFRAFTTTQKRADAWRLVGRLASCILLAFALSAFLLLPMVEFLNSGVDTHRGTPHGVVAMAINRNILLYFLPLVAGPIYSARFFAGKAFIYGYFGVGCGVLALTAVLLAFRRAKRDQQKLMCFFGVALAICMAKYFGMRPIQWLGYLPVLRLVNFPQYLQPVSAFCVAALSAYSADRLMRGLVRFEMLTAVIALAVVSAIYAVKFGSLVNAPGDLHQFFFYSLAIGIGVAQVLLVVALFTLWRAPSVRPKMIFSILLVLLTSELGANYIYPIYNYSQKLPLITADPYKGAPYIDFLQKRNIGLDRVFGHDELFPSWASVFQIFDSRFLSAISPGRLFTFGRIFFNGQQTVGSGELADRFTGDGLPYSFSNPREQRFLQLSSTRFVVTPTALSLPVSNALIQKAVEQNSVTTRFRETEFTIDGETRPVLLEHPPMSRVPLVVQVPADRSILRFSPALNPALFGSTCGDGVTFGLEMAGPDGRITPLYSRYIDPKHNLAEQHWMNDSVDLSKFAGRDIKLLLSTGGGPKNDYSCDWAGWGGLSFAETRDVPNLKLIYDAEAKIYEFSHPLPRASFFRNAKVVNKEEDALQMVADANIDVTRQAIVVNAKLPPFEDDLLHRVEKAEHAPVIPAQIVAFASQRVGIRTNSKTDGIVMLTDTFFPGWNVYVDNQKRTVLQTGYMFRGVLVEKGSHLVEFRYEDAAIRLGGGISFLGLLGTAGIAACKKYL